MFREESIFIKKLMKKSSSNNVMQLRKSIAERATGNICDAKAESNGDFRLARLFSCNYA